MGFFLFDVMKSGANTKDFTWSVAKGARGSYKTVMKTGTKTFSGSFKAATGVGDFNWSAMKSAPGAFKTAMNVARGAGKFAWGPRVWGLGGLVKGKGALAARLAIPGLLLGAYGAFQLESNLIDRPYDMNSPLASWGYDPGARNVEEFPIMSFGQNRSSIYSNTGATGSLSFALHNNRKA